MKRFIEELRRALKKHFYESEANEICAYYEEMINERIDHGEKLDDVLKEYEIKDILTQMLPDVAAKRKNTPKNMVKSSNLLLILLLTTPLLIPLGVTYIVLFIVFFAMIITGFSLILSGFAVVFAFGVQLLLIEIAVAEGLLLFGVGLIVASLLMLIGYVMIAVFKWIMKMMIVVTSRLAKSIGGK